jgi:hypothetical protein
MYSGDWSMLIEFRRRGKSQGMDGTSKQIAQIEIQVRDAVVERAKGVSKQSLDHIPM